MASTRCPNCNFLNFDTAPQCKRCRGVLNASPETAYAGIATSGVERSARAATSSAPSARPQHTFNEPPPPNFYRELGAAHPRPFITDAPPAAADREAPVNEIPFACVKCGIGQDLELQDFKKDYIPPAAYITVMFNPIILLIVILVTRKQHKVSALFCPKCWGKFKDYKTICFVTGGVAFAGLIGAIVAVANIENMILMISAWAIPIIIAIGGTAYAQRIAPVYGKITRHEVFIKVPDHGEVDFSNSGW
ncbi:MAG TPA: hypothetical protein VGO50_21375 [Pyrinomonadaceae bacterium]|jgi:hypothetical protein|nr:hypothetical protein [Pyrinomonadaceae bacterium]